MARGSSYGEKSNLPPSVVTPQMNIPRRATRVLPEVRVEEEEEKETRIDPIKTRLTTPIPNTRLARRPSVPLRDEISSPLERHRSWLNPFIICLVCVIIGIIVAASAGIFQRNDNAQIVPYNGQSFPIQLGGSVSAFNTWENSTGPIPAKTAIPTPVKGSGSYRVLGAPTITADFINKVLASYNSPAAGKGQALYDYGVKYGIDPVFALAFFMHESLFGTTGVARTTLSLGNLRCIPTRPCIFKNIGGFAQMYSWEDGFEQWYKLIRNLYVAQWGLVTVDQIIPVYAPSSDHNDVAAYIRSLKHEIDTWHAGILRP